MNRTLNSVLALCFFVALATGSSESEEVVYEGPVEAVDLEMAEPATDAVEEAPTVCDEACLEECTADLLGGPTYNDDMDACDAKCGC